MHRLPLAIAFIIPVLAFPASGQNQAISLDGSDDCVVIDDHADFDSIMTIEFWYLQRGPGDGYGVQHQVALFSDSNGQSSPQNLHQWQIKLQDQSSSHPFSPFRFEASWDRELVTGVTDLDFLEWHHVATTWDGVEILTYVDGILENQSPYLAAPSPWSHDIYLGAQDVLGTVARELDGTIDELRLWTIPRSESEIRNSMGLELDLQPGLLTVWHFNGDLNEPTGNYFSAFLGNGMFVPSTAPLNLDGDNDGLLDDDELVIYGTDPDLFDTDGDGLNDGQELGVTYGTAPADTNPAVFLEDTDPLTTTDPLLYDTDGGGTSDGNEDVDKNGAIDIDEHDPNDPLDDLFQLSVLGLSPGQQATISVWECRPGSVVVPLFSMAGQTTRLVPDYNQLELALSNPINQLTGMTIGPGGTAFSTIWVPPYVSIGVSVYWQAVEVTGGGEAYRPSIPITAVVQ